MSSSENDSDEDYEPAQTVLICSSNPEDVSNSEGIFDEDEKDAEDEDEKDADDEDEKDAEDEEEEFGSTWKAPPSSTEPDAEGSEEEPVSKASFLENSSS